MNAFEAAEKNGKALELQHELEVLFNSQNKNSDNATSIPATFLRVTIKRYTHILNEKHLRDFQKIDFCNQVRPKG